MIYSYRRIDCFKNQFPRKIISELVSTQCSWHAWNGPYSESVSSRGGKSEKVAWLSFRGYTYFYYAK